MTPRRGPFLARLILALATPGRDRDPLLQDLDDEYRLMRTRGYSILRARMWYWRQVTGSVGPGLRRYGNPQLPNPGSSSGLRHDLRYALRSLRREPLFAAVATVTLALGIGATVTMFSVVRGVLLHPLPYHEPDRVVRLMEERVDRPEFGQVSYPDFHDIRERSTTLSGVAASGGWEPTLMVGEQPMRVRGAAVSAEYFDVLGVTPELGRLFSPEEGRPGHAPVVAISWALFQQVFAGDQSIVGSVIQLNGSGYTVVGVVDRDFEDHRGGVQVWLAQPSWFNPETTSRTGHNIRPIARLADGVTLEQANAELRAISAQLELEFPEHADHRVQAVPIEEFFTGDVRLALTVLQASVVLVLLIACANVANLLLSRAARRERELAVRAALGARRRRIISQLLVEGGVLALCGAAVGLLLAQAGLEYLVGLAGAGLPRAQLVTLDGGMVAFALGLSLVTVLAFALTPALLASRVDLIHGLKEGRSTAAGRRRSRLRGILVVSEVALSVLLLVGAGLMLRTFAELQAVDEGFDPDGLVVMSLSPSTERWPGFHGPTQYYQAVLERVNNLPGVSHAAVVTFAPMSGSFSGEMVFRTDIPEPGPSERTGAEARAITPGYFEALGIPLLRGRSITAADDSAAARVVVVNQAFVDEHFPDGADPIGTEIWTARNTWMIVGVVGNVRQFGVQREPNSVMYASQSQPWFWYLRRWMTLVVATDGDPASLIPSLRREVWAVDNTVPISDAQPLSQLVADDVAEPRFRATLLGAFGLLALILAGVGLAGVLAYGVAQRSGEIGIRMALGAQRSQVLGQILGDGLKLVGLGLVLGLAGALLGSRVISHLLFGVSPIDLPTFVSVPLALGLTGLLAGLVPAIRASRVDPMVALRSE